MKSKTSHDTYIDELNFYYKNNKEPSINDVFNAIPFDVFRLGKPYGYAGTEFGFFVCHDTGHSQYGFRGIYDVLIFDFEYKKPN